MFACAVVVVATAGTTPRIPDLARPVKIVDYAYYMDGGTVGVTLSGTRRDTLSGGFDGRMREESHSYPQHCYVGGPYVKGAGVRLLPLWGTEERAFVSLVQQGIESEISRDKRRRLLATTSAIRLSLDDVRIWQLVRRSEDRRQLLDALDRGEMLGDRATLSYFEAKAPITLDRIRRDGSSKAFEIVIGDGASGGHTIYLPADPAKVASGPTTLGGKFHLSMPAGTNEDRLLMQLVYIALRDDRTHVAPSLRAQVRELLKIRRERILDVDRTR